MSIIKNLISYLFHYVFGAYKDNTVEEVSEINHDTTTLHVSTVNGVIIRFYCKKNNFVIKNDHPYVPDYKFSVYKLYGECGENNCPEKLKTVLQKIAYFPTLGPVFKSEENRRKFLIETYIGLLNTDLKLKKA